MVKEQEENSLLVHHYKTWKTGYGNRRKISVSNRTELQEASAIGRKMVKCGCKPEKGCSGRCKSLKSALMYTNSVNVTGNARLILN